ncbi:hypothetical protein EON82_05695 [bacterium]|nr:MAG: hypothetical protein EON82_05695 [bacterium]
MSPEDLKALRRQAPPAERLLWEALRAKQTGDKWRRGHPLGDDYLPLFCRSRGLCVQTTPLSPEVEAAREAQGIRTMVLNSGRVLGNVQAAVAQILSGEGSPWSEARTEGGSNSGWKTVGEGASETCQNTPQVSTANELIEKAFDRLDSRPGYRPRPDQRQLALLLSDLIEGDASGAFEAPTGLGKSLAALIPAIAHAIVGKRKTVVATYTNVLAEQYWRSDLPLALSLFEDQELPRTALLMGRARYACLAQMDEHAPEHVDVIRREGILGIETEFRRLVPRGPAWSKISSPPVCPGRLCPAYDDCFYYGARKNAENAEVIVTNHSVVIQHALMASIDEEREGLLGKYDFLILDEAHDFPQAALNGMEFELSVPKLNAIAGVAGRLESSLTSLAQRCGDGGLWLKTTTTFKDELERASRELVAYGLSLGKPGILTASPPDLLDHPQVKNHKTGDDMAGARAVAEGAAAACERLAKATIDFLRAWREKEPERARQVQESTNNYVLYLREFGLECARLFVPTGVAVSYSGRNGNEPMLRQDILGIAEPLRELIWNRTPYACLSATLAVDGSFEYFRRTTGCEPTFEETLPSPFDFASQAAIYLPPQGTIPDPTEARRNGTEDQYHWALARQVEEIIRACDGRTLALFHSRREMEAVLSMLNLPPELPVYSQTRYGVGTVGERFRREVHSSLFALRSFWTGFDAPGETLSCVALVRVPFEVPTDPPQIARLAWLQQQGLDPFREHTLPQAKMMMRQGAGRLVRRAGDKGVIALLDARLQTKRYGEEILANLPPEMSTFRDIADAVGWIGLEPRTVA